jgi:hypothetical protein
MSTRHFADSHGLEWDVWDVHPRDIPSRPMTDVNGRSDTAVAHNLTDGWLCFQAGRERRRFAPIPWHWDELPDGVLRVMLDVSDTVTRAPDAHERRPEA